MSYLSLAFLTIVTASFHANRAASQETMFERLHFVDGSTLCVVDRPMLTAELSTVTEEYPTGIAGGQCVPVAARCARFSVGRNYSAFNYNASSNQCHFYRLVPLLYSTNVSDCAGYINKNFTMCIKEPVISADSYAAATVGMTPAPCCSFPFTLSGRLYYRCADAPYSVGCYVRNHTWMYCLPPTDYSVQYTRVNVSIPSFDGLTSLPMVNNWITIMERKENGSFLGDWSQYKDGFGNTEHDFWLGLERMHQLTAAADYRVRFEMQSLQYKTWYSVEYDYILIDSESTNYTLRAVGYDGGDGRDVLWSPTPTGRHNGMQFSTADVDNDRSNDNCAAAYRGGFWFNSCSYFCLTCAANYFHSRLFVNGSIWNEPLMAARIMIKMT